MAQLNKNTCRPLQVLQAISREYPGLWKNIDATRARHQKGSRAWPDSCFIPTSQIRNLINRLFISHTNKNREQKILIETARISALAAWRSTQSIYRFDADVYEALLSTPMDSGFPLEALHHLPDWCVYIETPFLLFMGEIVYGAWIHIDFDSTTEMNYLCILIDAEVQITIRVQLTHEPIEEQLKKIAAKYLAQREMYIFSKSKLLIASVSLLSTLISLALYICTQASEVDGGAERLANPPPPRRRGGEFRTLAPNRVTTWEVGVRMGAALRLARQHSATSEGGSEEGLRNSPRGHVRRAHWHKALTGPRKNKDGTVVPTSQRKLKVRWQQPLAINVKDLGALPATVRAVGPRAALPKRLGALACLPALPALHSTVPLRA